MTNEPDSTPRRRPPTIDLKATEVEQPSSPAATGAAETASARTGEKAVPGERTGASAGAPFGAAMGVIIGAVAGVIAMVAIVAVLWAAGLVPPRGTATPAGKEPATAVAASATAAVAALAARLDKIEGAHAVPPPEPTLAARMGAAEAAAKTLGDSLVALNHRLDDSAAMARSALARADAAAAAAEAAKSTAQQSGLRHGDLDALANRLAGLESAVKALSADVSGRSAGVDDRIARMSVAAEALRAAVERGAPYQAEFAAVKALGVDASDAAALESAAATGVPSEGALARALSALLPDLRRALTPASDQSSFLGRLEANANRLVRVTPIEASAADDSSTTIARIGAAAARADIVAALAEMARLPDAGRAVAASWTKQAAAREAAVAASRRIAAAAFAALGRPPSQ